ncbi:hypothetical protein CO701_15400 [Citrobacter werkmanii]|nr:hypothetical protein CO701_15400 [Citrobacter werkmanii]
MPTDKGNHSRTVRHAETANTQDCTLCYTIYDLYPSYFKLHVRWLSSLTPVTYLCTLLDIRCVAALMQLELFRV